MANFKVTKRILRTTPGLQTFDFAGFGIPKAALFLLSGNTADDIIEADTAFGIGFTDGLNHAAMSVSSILDDPIEESYHRFDSQGVNVVALYKGTDAVCLATFDSWHSDGVILNFSEVPVIDLYLTVVLIGGIDIESANVRSIAMQDGLNSINDIPTRPDCIISIGGNHKAGYSVDSNLTIGYATSINNQMSSSFFTRHIDFGIEKAQHIGISEVFHQVSTGVVDWNATIIDINNNGFDIVASEGTEGGTASGEIVYFLCLTAPQLEFNIDKLDLSNIDAGEYIVNNLDFQPEFAMVLSTDFREPAPEAPGVENPNVDKYGVSVFEETGKSSIAWSRDLTNDLPEASAMQTGKAWSNIEPDVLTDPETIFFADFNKFILHGYSVNIDPLGLNIGDKLSFTAGPKPIERPPGSIFKQLRILLPTTTGIQTYEIPGMGRPHAMILFTSNSRIDDGPNGSGYFSIGLSDGEESRVFGMSSKNLGSPTVTKSYHRDKIILELRDHNGSTYTTGLFAGWATNGFKINYTAVVGTPRYLTILMIGGADISRAVVRDFVAEGNDFDYTGLGEKPDLIFMGSAGLTVNNGLQLNSRMQFGIGIEDLSEDSNVKQASFSFLDHDAVATTNTWQAALDSHIHIWLSALSTAIESVGQISDFTDNGFHFNLLDAEERNHVYFFLAVSFIRKPFMNLGYRLSPNSDGNIFFGGLPFDPNFGMILTTDLFNTSEVDIAGADSYGFSLFDDASQSFNGQYSKDNSATATTGNVSSDRVMRDVETGTSDLHTGDFVSFGNNGYTFNMTLTPTFSRQWLEFTVGENDTILSGSLSEVLADIGFSSSGVLTVTTEGTLAVTLDDIGFSASGDTSNNGSLSKVLEDVTLSSAGDLVPDLVGVLSETLDDDTLAGAGLVTLIGTGYIAIILDDVTLSSSGDVTNFGVLSEVLDDVGLTANGTLTNATEGTISVTLEDVTSTGDIGQTLFGGISETLGAVTSNIVGVVAEPIFGTLSEVLDDVVSNFNLFLVWYGTVDITLEDDTLFGEILTTPFEHVWTEQCPTEPNWFAVPETDQSIERC